MSEGDEHTKTLKDETSAMILSMFKQLDESQGVDMQTRYFKTG